MPGGQTLSWVLVSPEGGDIFQPSTIFGLVACLTLFELDVSRVPGVLIYGARLLIMRETVRGWVGWLGHIRCYPSTCYVPNLRMKISFEILKCWGLFLFLFF